MIRFFFILSLLFSVAFSYSQGLSFSYFIPSQGYLSNPVSPFSIRGVGLSLGDYIKLETGGSLYHIGGIGLEGVDFESMDALAGPHFSLLVPLELALKFAVGPAQLKFSGGVFGVWHLNPRLNYGNLDRAMADHLGYWVLNSEFEAENTVGGGWLAGTELAFYVTKQVALTFGVHYLDGSSGFALSGSYDASNGQGLESGDLNFPDARLPFNGIEFSVGVILSGS